LDVTPTFIYLTLFLIVRRGVVTIVVIHLFCSGIVIYVCCGVIVVAVDVPVDAVVHCGYVGDCYYIAVVVTVIPVALLVYVFLFCCC
jgi:hypothetical protein